MYSNINIVALHNLYSMKSAMKLRLRFQLQSAIIENSWFQITSNSMISGVVFTVRVEKLGHCKKYFRMISHFSLLTFLEIGRNVTLHQGGGKFTVSAAPPNSWSIRIIKRCTPTYLMWVLLLMLRVGVGRAAAACVAVCFALSWSPSYTEVVSSERTK